jgi:hypothetical protein
MLYSSRFEAKKNTLLLFKSSKQVMQYSSTKPVGIKSHNFFKVLPNYFLYTKNKNPESGKPIVLIVFSALVISLLFSVALYMFTDSDGDSFPDRNDPCPEYGINNGCP